jgi:hypothetical protein
MIDAAEQARTLVAGHAVAEIESDRLRCPAVELHRAGRGEYVVTDQLRKAFRALSAASA